jgi:toxin ParE1/3/4
MRRYRLDVSARSDLVSIRTYIARDNPPAAARLISEFKKRFRLLASQPQMAERRPDIAPELRGFSVGNYVIFYRATKGGIEVARVIHGARDIRAQFAD